MPGSVPSPDYLVLLSQASDCWKAALTLGRTTRRVVRKEKHRLPWGHVATGFTLTKEERGPSFLSRMRC